MRDAALVLVAAWFAAAGCAAPRGGAVGTTPPLAPRLLPADAAAKPLGAEALLAALTVEPPGCALYAGDDRPDLDVKSLQCIVDWMRDAQDYLARGGKPTASTNAAAFDRHRDEARALSERLSRTLAGKRERLAAAKTAPAPAPPADDPARSSQQHYLSGVIYYQKGDYEKARAEWSLAVGLDAANDDAKKGLARLRDLYGAQ